MFSPCILDEREFLSISLIRIYRSPENRADRLPCGHNPARLRPERHPEVPGAAFSRPSHATQHARLAGAAVAIRPVCARRLRLHNFLQLYLHFCSCCLLTPPLARSCVGDGGCGDLVNATREGVETSARRPARLSGANWTNRLWALE
jgi:hypothetical protein